MKPLYPVSGMTDDTSRLFFTNRATYITTIDGCDLYAVNDYSGHKVSVVVGYEYKDWHFWNIEEARFGYSIRDSIPESVNSYVKAYINLIS